jgi:hypothetical protein
MVYVLRGYQKLSRSLDRNNRQYNTERLLAMNSTSSSSSYVVTPTATDGPCSADFGNLPLPQQPDHPIYILGIEGSANKVAVGIVKYCPQQNTYHIIANPRKTYHAPAGHGFLPKETAWHHQAHIVGMLRKCVYKVAVQICG